MRKRQQPPETDLPEPEPAVHRPGPQATDDPVRKDDRRARDDESQHGSDQRRHQDLADQPSADQGLVPSAASAAPTTPPIRAWDELDGSPYHQVIRFHVIAPIRPANTIVGVIRSACTIPFATVAATSRR